MFLRDKIKCGFLIMDFIDAPLRGPQDVVSGIVGPSVDLWDVSTIKALIELRQSALANSAVIAWRPYLEVGRRGNEID